MRLRIPACRLTLISLAVLALAYPLTAFAETNGSRPAFVASSTIPPLYQTQGCWRCHADFSESSDTNAGPHHDFSAATDKCDLCHTLHDASGGTTTWPMKPASSDSVKLLPAATIADSCVMCHDGTGGSGVYGTIAARGLTAGGGHRAWPETTSVVPGGDADTGGDATVVFNGKDGALTCSDCHSPHGSNLVAPYYSDRFRNSLQKGLQYEVPHYSSKLLKERPTSSDTTVTEYGSSWCASCHKGRHSGSAVNNHPVESDATDPNAYTYATVQQVPEVATGISVGASGHVYVCDPGNRRVQEFTGTGAFVRSYLGGGTDNNGLENPRFYWPAGVSVLEGSTWTENDGSTGSGTIMLVNDPLYGMEEYHNGVLANVTTTFQGELPSGVAVFRIANWMGWGNLSLYTGTNMVEAYDYHTQTPYYWRSSNATAGLTMPQSIATGPSADGLASVPVYVADTGNDRIVRARYYADAQPPSYAANYVTLGSFGTKGTGDGQFDHPGSVAVDPSSGNVYVADGNNDRIQVFDANGVFLRKWGTHGTGPGQFDWPDGIAVDSAGNVVVADRGNDRIEVFDTSGAFIRQWGTRGTGDGQFLFNGSVSARDVATVDQYGERTVPYAGLGVGNGGYLMNDPRSPGQAGHAPICQQCHEDSRDVGRLEYGSAQPSLFRPSVDGSLTVGGPGYGNPRFQDFPHETENANLLVEQKDDLCLNCHNPARLP